MAQGQQSVHFLWRIIAFYKDRAGVFWVSVKLAIYSEILVIANLFCDIAVCAHSKPSHRDIGHRASQLLPERLCRLCDHRVIPEAVYFSVVIEELLFPVQGAH